MNPIRRSDDITLMNDIDCIADELQRIGCLVFHDQNLTEKSYVNLMKSFGECEAPDLFMNLKEYPEIFLVTGKRDDDGKSTNCCQRLGDSSVYWKHFTGGTKISSFS